MLNEFEELPDRRSELIMRYRDLTPDGLDRLVHDLIKERSYHSIEAIVKCVHKVTHAANPRAPSFGSSVLSKVLHRVADWVAPGKWIAKPTYAGAQSGGAHVTRAANAPAPASTRGDACTSNDTKNAKTDDDGNAKDVQLDATLVDGGGVASAVRAPALKDFVCLNLYEAIGVTEEEFEVFERQYTYEVDIIIETHEAYEDAFAYFSRICIVQLNLNAWIDSACREIRALPANGRRKDSIYDHTAVFNAILNQQELFTRARVLLHKMTRELERLHEKLDRYRILNRTLIGSAGTTVEGE